MDTAPTRQIPAEQIPVRLAYNIRETAILLGGISTKSIRRLIERGLLQRSNGLRHILIPRSEIERFLRETLWSAS